MRPGVFLAFGVGSFVLPLALSGFQSRTDSPHGSLDADCGVCHTADGWSPIKDGPGFDHAASGFPLEASHASVECTACHETLVFDEVGATCAECHEDVHAGELGFQCQTCHSPRSWDNRHDQRKLHDQTRFPLFGAHVSLDCEACHSTQRPYQYASTPTECGACHLETYAETRDPNHDALGFGRQCEECHLPFSRSWRETTFQHPASFPLRGAHRAAVCTDCHASGFSGAPRECAACHRPDYDGAANPNHGALGLSLQCESCHRETGWQPADFDHELARFRLTGAHRAVECDACHGNGRFSGTPGECNSCHAADYDTTAGPNHAAAGFPRQCEGCHTTTAWSPANFDHDQTAFPLTGAHAARECSDCHSGGTFTGTSAECVACHRADYDATRDPSHSAAGFPLACEGCHVTGAWRPANFDHNQTAFPLTGAHQRLDCASCHQNGGFSGVSAECFACHGADYQSTRNPDHASAGFPTQCAACHTTRAWVPADFDHNSTRFRLTGAHRQLECAACHTGGVFSGAPTDCFSCHRGDYQGTRNPDHQAAGFPRECQACHTTSAWTPASFDHDATRFPLTGAHRQQRCEACHGGGYSGTPTACYACHDRDYAGTSSPNHAAASFPTRCDDCHSTRAWRPATFDHDSAFFPIYSGKHRGKWNACSDCHPNPGNFRVFECINCHQHAKPKMDDKHKEESGYVYASVACLDCHPRGRKE